MKRVIFFRLAGRDVHMPRLIGAFILVAAFLMFVQASASMFDSWDSAKAVSNCLKAAELDGQRIDSNPGIFDECQDNAAAFLGIHVRQGQEDLTARQFWGSLLGPIAAVLFWIAILFLGYMLYRTGDLVLPIEERITMVPDEPKPKAVSVKKKK